MYFSRVTLRPEGADPKRIAQVARADAYGTHQYLWKLFPEIENRDFLFRRDDEAPWPRFFLVSSQPPRDDTGLWRVETKPYEPALSPGQQLAFQLRANPVRSRKDESGKSKRHDVVMDARKHSDPPRPMPELIQTEGLAWLAARAEKSGFRVDPGEVRVEGYRQHRIRKAKRQIGFSTLDFTGLLTVEDPQRLLVVLYRGIGPAKAFGCGLMLVRRT